MGVDARDTGWLIVRAYKGNPFYEAMWRNGAGRQRKRRLGRAWLEQDSDGHWVKRRGRIPSDFLDEKRAYLEMGRVIAEVEAEPQPEPGSREPIFDDAVAAWLEHLENREAGKALDFGRVPESPLPSAPPKPLPAWRSDHARLQRSEAAQHRDQRHSALPLLFGQGRHQRPHRQHAPPGPSRDLPTLDARRRFRPQGEPGGGYRQAARRRTPADRDFRAAGNPRHRSGGSKRAFTAGIAATPTPSSPRTPSASGSGSTSRMRRSSSLPPTAPACAWESCLPCAGRTSTSRPAR